MKQKVTYRVAVLGVLGALAISLNYLENLLPPVALLPPGAKLGFSNLAVMVAAKKGGVRDAMLIALLKALFVLLSRGGVAFWMSLAGGLLSALVTGLALHPPQFNKKKHGGESFAPFGYIGIGIMGAVCHNAGQLAAAMLLTGPAVAVGYGPWLLLFALLTGAASGVVLRVVMPRLERLEDYI